MGLGDAGDDRVVEQTAPQRGPGLGDDTALGIVGTLCPLREPRVQLDLVDGRDDAGRLGDRVEDLRVEVRHTDTAGLACGT